VSNSIYFRWNLFPFSKTLEAAQLASIGYLIFIAPRNFAPEEFIQPPENHGTAAA